MSIPQNSSLLYPFLLIFLSSLGFYLTTTNFHSAILLATRHSSPHHSSKQWHLFPYAAFFYPNSTSFATQGVDSLVVLMAADKDWPQGINLEGKKERFYCYHRAVEGYVWRSSQALMLQLGRNEWCRMELFVVICPLGASGVSPLPLPLVYLKPGFNSQAFPVIPRLAHSRSFRLNTVVCMSRLFAFEQWKMLLVTMEVYRHFGADIVAVYIQSVLTEIYRTLFKAYESDNRLAIRMGLELPAVEGLPYHPNHQSEWSNQLASAHECLYEYREAADFIALMDLDDLLMPGLGIRSFGEAFSHLSLNHPSAAAFLVPRFDGSFLDSGEDPSTFSMSYWLERGVRYSQNQRIHPKLLVRPALTYGIWIHNATVMERGYGAVEVNKSEAIIVHLRDRKLYPHRLASHLLNSNQVETNYGFFAEKFNLYHLIPTLPFDRLYPNSLRQCNERLSKRRVQMIDAETERCSGYWLCAEEMPRVENRSCLQLKSEWERGRKVRRDTMVHLRRMDGTRLFERSDGCRLS